jgi:hypothetical protein
MIKNKYNAVDFLYYFLSRIYFSSVFRSFFLVNKPPTFRFIGDSIDESGLLFMSGNQWYFQAQYRYRSISFCTILSCSVPLIFSRMAISLMPALQTSIMFASKVRTYPCRASFRCSLLNKALDLTQKHKVGWKGLLATNTLVNYNCKKFYNTGTRLSCCL